MKLGVKAQQKILLKAQQTLLCFNACIWLVRLILWLQQYWGVKGVILYSVIIPVAMAINVVAFTVLTFFIRQKKESVYVVAEVFITVNFALSINNNMTVPEMAQLVLNLATFFVVAASSHK